MPNDTLNDDQTDRDNDEAESTQDRNWRELREKASDYEKRALTAERKLAFVEAGIDAGDPKMGYFIKGYDGEMTADAIRQAAIEAGFLEDKTAPPPAEQESIERIAEAGSTADPANQIPLEEALRNAKSEQEVMEIAARAGLPTVNDRAV